MPHENEPEHEGAEVEKVNRQAPEAPSDDDKPDEVLRPNQLTTENDGGGQG